MRPTLCSTHVWQRSASACNRAHAEKKQTTRSTLPQRQSPPQSPINSTHLTERHRQHKHKVCCGWCMHTTTRKPAAIHTSPAVTEGVSRASRPAFAAHTCRSCFQAHAYARSDEKLTGPENTQTATDAQHGCAQPGRKPDTQPIEQRRCKQRPKNTEQQIPCGIQAIVPLRTEKSSVDSSNQAT
jgi:hypothetical protein